MIKSSENDEILSPFLAGFVANNFFLLRCFHQIGVEFHLLDAAIVIYSTNHHTKGLNIAKNLQRISQKI
jgi:hypothetical protein